MSQDKSHWLKNEALQTYVRGILKGFIKRNPPKHTYPALPNTYCVLLRRVIRLHLSRKLHLWLSAKAEKAQIATELAIFGAILVFIVSVIVRNGLNASYVQNQSLKAMRLALSASYIGSEAQTTSRNQASVLVVEDRLSISTGPYGAVDRTPYIFQGQGSDTKLFFYPVDWKELYPSGKSLPRFDLIVNGQHFVFTVAEARTSRNFCFDDPDDNNDGISNGPGDVTEPCTLNPNWEPNCAVIHRVKGQDIPPGWADPNAIPPWVNQDVINALENPPPGLYVPPTSPGLTNVNESIPDIGLTVGCERFFKTAGNYPESSFCTCLPNLDPATCWCPGYPDICTKKKDDPGATCACAIPGTPCPNPGYNDIEKLIIKDSDARVAAFPDPTKRYFNPDQRFDLNRDGIPDVPVAGGQPTDRNTFAWQWDLVMAIKRTKGVHMIKGEPISDSKTDPINTSVDLDGDLKEEVIQTILETDPKFHVVITKFGYLDYQEGDVDFTRGNHEPGHDPGFFEEVQFFGRTQDGTFYQLTETGNYQDPGDSIRYEFAHKYVMTRKKGRVDIIQRVFQLNNNTGRLCSGTTPQQEAVETCADNYAGDPPGIKFAKSCFAPSRIATTCFDGNPGVLRLYIRSRVQDLMGRKWVTPVTCDCPSETVRPYTSTLPPRLKK